MSPEQALGQETDYRSDQFSFGLILYEMASGKQAFAKPTSIETMAAIVREEPPPIEEKIPAPLKWIIDRCLAKEPGQRYDSTRDLFHELKNLRDHLSEVYASGTFAPIVATNTKTFGWKMLAFCTACALMAALLTYVLKPAGPDIAKYVFSSIAADAGYQRWSPDGGSIAYAVPVDGTNQVFLRHLKSPVPVQLTHEKHDVVPEGWSSDGNHIILLETTGSTESPHSKLVSVSTVGGELEFIMNSDCVDACELSKDGTTWAELSRHTDGLYGISISRPFGSPLQPYAPAPFASKEVFNYPQVHFSPDGQSIFFFRTGDADRDEAWLLPLPSGSGTPHRVLTSLHFSQNPGFSWAPDREHLFVSVASTQNAPNHLWIADLQSDHLTPLTTGTANELWPQASPDGKSIAYSQVSTQFDLTSISLSDGTAKTLLSTGMEEHMPGWSANRAEMAWVTNRSGPYEIWVRMPDESVRPVVTAADFPPETNKWFYDPAPSPDGDRLVYLRIDRAGVARLWISALSGGAPVRLTNADTSECGGTWSPDGSRVAFLSQEAGKTSLMIARVSGNAEPVAIRTNGPSIEKLSQGAPEWSPTGEWITYRDLKGWYLISPDGKRSKFLGNIPSDYLAFSKDGKLLYGMDAGNGSTGGKQLTLFSLDPLTLKQKTIRQLGPEFEPSGNWTYGIRFSIAPDGKSFTYATGKVRNELWMLTGYRQPGLWNQIKDALHLTQADNNLKTENH
jgi:Tol biopolymer transport system component